MSYGFSNSNFFNTGIKLDYKLEKFNFMAGVTNASDFKSAIDAGSTQKNFIGQFGYTREKSKFIYSVQTLTTNVFPNNTILNNLIVEHQFSDKLILAVDITNTNIGTYSKRRWNSLALYAKYAVNDKLHLNYRGEILDTNIFSAKNMLYNYKAGNVLSNTFTSKFKLSNSLTILPEIRLDASDKKIFTLDNKLSNINAFFLVGTTYQF